MIVPAQMNVQMGLFFRFFLHLAEDELAFEVGFVHLLADLGHGAEETGELVGGGEGLAVGLGHAGGVGAFAEVIDFDVPVFVEVEEGEDTTVLAGLEVGLLDAGAEVGGLVAVGRGRGLGEAAIGGGDTHGGVVDVGAAAVDGGEGVGAQLVGHEAEEAAVSILLDDLRGVEVVAHLLVLGVFLEGEAGLQGIEFLLLGAQEAVEVGKGLLLLLELDFAHEGDAGTAGFEGFGIEHFDGVDEQLGLAVVALLVGLTGGGELLAGFLLDVFASEEGGTEAGQEDEFLHICCSFGFWWQI